MSTHLYYNDGHQANSQMKADLKRVRQARPDRYVERKVKEQRHSPDGGTVTIEVNVEPNALAPTPKQRHELWTRRAK